MKKVISIIVAIVVFVDSVYAEYFSILITDNNSLEGTGYSYNTTDYQAQFEEIDKTIKELDKKLTVDELNKIADSTVETYGKEDIDYEQEAGCYPPFGELMTLIDIDKSYEPYYGLLSVELLKSQSHHFIKNANNYGKKEVAELALTKAKEYSDQFTETSGMDFSGMLFNNVKESSDASLYTVCWHNPSNPLQMQIQGKPVAADNVMGINTYYRDGSYGAAFEKCYNNENGKERFIKHLKESERQFYKSDSSTREKNNSGYSTFNDLEIFLAKWACDEDTLFRYMKRFTKDDGVTPDLHGMWEETQKRYKEKYGVDKMTDKLLYDKVGIRFNENKETEYTEQCFSYDWIALRAYMCVNDIEATAYTVIDGELKFIKDLSSKLNGEGITVKDLDINGRVAVCNAHHYFYAGKGGQFNNATTYKDLKNMTLTSSVNSYITKIPICDSPQDNYTLLSGAIFTKDAYERFKAIAPDADTRDPKNYLDFTASSEACKATIFFSWKNLGITVK